MNDGAAQAELIGLDWGSTTLRAYLLDENGRVLEMRTRSWGTRQLPTGGFDAALDGVLDAWPACPVLASGMVGSRGGWREVPYVDVPANLAAVAGALSFVDSAAGRRVHLVPGLRNTKAADVMRGEETEIFGALALQPVLAANSALLLPGTHSKWVRVRDGRVVDFATAMTGELYAALRHHTILVAGLPEQDPESDQDAFLRGVEAARNSGAAGALGRLFSARALVLAGELEPLAVPDYLSGLLIGEELRSALAAGRIDCATPLQLIGNNALCRRYAAAATCFELGMALPPQAAAALGLWQIARRAGLTSPALHFLAWANS
ncbi:MAG TPA: 2-dehydro-3-deoxygalactonokinase [Rhodanobacter sp.]|nr:2-dehydro-3-deoxygalactonokinase [Rhodanobacter sp.]